MATNPLFYDATVKAAVDAVAALCNSGSVRVYSGAQPALNGAVGTLLATATFGASAFAASVAAGGTVTATANAITSGTIAATGTAAYFALVKSDGTTIVATGTAGTSGADMILNSTAFVTGASFGVSALTLTEAQT